MKRLCALLIVICLSFSTVACAEPWRVFDSAGLFTEEDIIAIEEAIFQFQRSTNFDFAVLTTDDFLGGNTKVIGDYFYDVMNFGFGSQASGILFYIDMNQRVPCVTTMGEMIFVFDHKLDSAFDVCVPYLQAGAYKDAVLKMIELVTEAATAAK